MTQPRPKYSIPQQQYWSKGQACHPSRANRGLSGCRGRGSPLAGTVAEAVGSCAPRGGQPACSRRTDADTHRSQGAAGPLAPPAPIPEPLPSVDSSVHAVMEPESPKNDTVVSCLCFSFFLTYPGLGTEETSNPEMPSGTGRQRRQKCSAISSLWQDRTLINSNLFTSAKHYTKRGEKKNQKTKNSVVLPNQQSTSHIYDKLRASTTLHGKVERLPPRSGTRQ